VKVLLVTYCLLRDHRESMIGVYKRSLRVGIALSDRGHEVLLLNPGSTSLFSDDLTERALRRITVVDLPYIDVTGEGEMGLDETGHKRQVLLEQLPVIGPDLVVLGESPLSGTLLEVALCTAELGIPVGILDNAYSPVMVTYMCKNNGGIADGLVLTGPSSFHNRRIPAHIGHLPPFIQVPPFVENVPGAARGLVTDLLGSAGDRLITVFAYDPKVEQVALDVASNLEGSGSSMLFLSRHPDSLRKRLANLDSDIAVQAIPPPSDPVLFDLLRMSRIAIVKYGFMQVTEAISLGTPVLAVYYDSPHWLKYTPIRNRPFIRVTSGNSMEETIAAVEQLMDIDGRELVDVHTGGFDAADEAARFLEQLPGRGRRDTLADCADKGLSLDRMTTALTELENGTPVTMRSLHGMRVTSSRQQEVYALVSNYTAAEHQRVARLKGSVYGPAGGAGSDAAASAAAGRQVLYSSADDRLLLEAIPPFMMTSSQF
jgi:hypothetical protein